MQHGVTVFFHPALPDAVNLQQSGPCRHSPLDHCRELFVHENGIELHRLTYGGFFTPVPQLCKNSEIFWGQNFFVIDFPFGQFVAPGFFGLSGAIFYGQRPIMRVLAANKLPLHMNKTHGTQEGVKFRFRRFFIAHGDGKNLYCRDMTLL